MVNATIEELNTEEAKQYIGGVVFIAIVMVVGVVGNVHVIFVYAFKMKPSNHRIFILVLAILDVITCAVGMPFILVHLRNPLTFKMVAACKLFRFIIDFVSAGAIFVLLLISVERYRKICVPLGQQMSQKAAKIACLTILGISLLLSWPALVLYGRGTVQIAGQNMTGTRCYTDDMYKDTNLQAIQNGVFISIVFGVFTVLVVLYSLIGRAIKRHPNFLVKPISSTTGVEASSSGAKIAPEVLASTPSMTSNKAIQIMNPNEPSERALSSGSITVREQEQNSVTPDTDAKDTAIASLRRGRKTQTIEHKFNKFNKVQNITYMLFIITVVFFFSYIPNLILKIVLFAMPSILPNMSFAGRVTYYTFIWCFFINNAANPIIYGFCHERFRRELFGIYLNIVARCRKGA